MATRSPIPVGVNLTTMGVSAAWWLESAQRLEAAGFRSAWAWDHFMSFARLKNPETSVLECWTLLAAVAARTTHLRVGSFVTNVMNRHPAVLAREVATVAALAGAGDRVEVGIGIGGHPTEHEAYGIDFPEPRERARHLAEALEVLRLLLGGGPVDFEGPFHRLSGAHAFPVPQPRPRLIVGAETPAGARIAAHGADGLALFADDWERTEPAYLAALEAEGRARADMSLLAAVEVEDPVLADLGAVAAQWNERGADELVLHWVKPEHLDAVLAAGERAGLRG
jgi:alkanesulfonate monooxygenase SsuD/methylene tetrahydromethanopterin reductase-like flavin-dependent oxidoreductase (luciferase family)